MSQDYPHPFGKFASRFRKFRGELPKVVSNMARNEFVRNFKKQGHEGEKGGFNKWKPTAKKKKGILIVTGRLMRSMRPEPRLNEARVVSNLPYAKPHNEGFEGTVRVRSHKRNRYGKKEEKYTTRSGNSRTKVVNVKKGSGKVKAHSRKMNIEARPFITTSKTLLDDIEKHAFDEIEKIWNNL
tara:strand:+ start:672 stop:1220 length:549 start_codon:yes stop_codon:yes gene_type:complete